MTAYRYGEPLDAYLQRLREERKRAGDELFALLDWRASLGFSSEPWPARRLIGRQITVLTELVDVLDQRIRELSGRICR